MSDASCAVEVAAVRAHADDGAEQVTQVLKGEPLVVEERRDGWARIRTRYEYPGWIREEALGPPAAEDWLGPPRDGDPIEEARSYVGAPYEWGGMTERGIDCSGLVHMAYRRLGRLVPRDAHQQEEAGTRVPPNGVCRGDLLTYGDRGGTAHHIAFWLGDGLILHSTRRDGVDGVIEEPEPDYLRLQRRFAIRLS